jgi:adenylate cyclase
MKFKWSDFAWFYISALVLGLVLLLRAGGSLQRAELLFYDRFMRREWSPSPSGKGEFLPSQFDDRIVVCGMTDEDLVRYGHPINDARLAELLEKLTLSGVAVIGVDLYRDLKEPRSGEGYARLASTLEKNDRIICIERLGKIKPPPALAGKPERVAPNNMPRDYAVDDVFRRAYLFLEDGVPEPRPSLALALALEYLAGQNVDVQMTEAPGGAPVLKLGRVVFPRITPDAGCYTKLRVGDYETLVDYRRPVGFPSLSFGDVLENPPLEEELRGKIVLVATVMDSVKDSNKSPVNDSHRGVLQHAAVIHQLLEAGLAGVPPIGWWPEWGEVMWTALASLIGGGLGVFCASPWRLAPLMTLGVSGLVAVWWRLMATGVWSPVAAPGLGFMLSAAFVTSFVAYAHKASLGVMKSIFSRHVSEKVVDALWEDRESFMQGGQLRAQRLTATVFFTDLKNFSTTSEKMDPATLLEWMNEYMSAMAPQVELHGGIINKYIGDSIMAIFGVPIARKNEEEISQDAVNAVECALGMREALKVKNEEWKGRGLPTTFMRVGINTGDLVSGSFGSRERLEFTVLGDTVNTGARLEGAGKEIRAEDCDPECTILVSETTYQRLGNRYRTRYIGPMKLKGKGESITVYSVLPDV